MGYYVKGVRLADQPGIAKYTSATINSRFKGMNLMTTLDALPMTSGFEAYSSYALTGYKWGGAQINYVGLNSLKRNITKCSSVTSASTSGTTFTNALAYPKVYYVMFQAAGGKGGTDYGKSGEGGGSGYYTISRIALQPGSSFKVTHHDTYAECKLVTGAAYMQGAVRTAGYSFTMTASAGSPGGPNSPGVGFRSGGTRDGVNVNANSIGCDGYACPPHAIYGGQWGRNRASDPGSTSNWCSGGGGGASAGPYLRNTGGAQRTGGGGAYYYEDTYNTYSINASAGSYGGGGGANARWNPSANGGSAASLVYH